MADAHVYRQAFKAEALSRNPKLDLNTGSIADVFAGINALAWERQSRKLEYLLREASLDSAKDRISELAEIELAEGPRPERRGTGTVVFRRPTAAAGSGTIWAGTRVLLSSSGTQSVLVRVTADVDLPANGLAVSAPIEALEVRSAISAASGAPLDVLFDSSLQALDASVSAGEVAEATPVFLARVAQERIADRIGYAAAIEQACLDAGADEAIAIESTYGNGELGLNHVVVSKGGAYTQALIDACRIAVDSVAACGTDVAVKGMSSQPLVISAEVVVWDRTKVDVPQATEAANRLVVEYFTDIKRSILWTNEAIRALIARPFRGVKSVRLTSSAQPTGTLFSGASAIRWQVTSLGVKVING